MPGTEVVGHRAENRTKGVLEMVVAEWQVGQMLWSMIWFTLFFLWIWLVVKIFVDIFRSQDMGGWAKTLWTLFVIFLPYLGVFVYLIARGRSMAERDRDAVIAQDRAMRSYIQDAAGTSSNGPSELAKLADLKDRGVIDQAEFDQMKAKILT
jgi:hypothetical protein